MNRCQESWAREGMPCVMHSDLNCLCLLDEGHPGMCRCLCNSTAVKLSSYQPDAPEEIEDFEPPGFDVGHLKDQRWGGTLDETGE